MTDLEIFESLRPQVEPLSPDERAGMRLDLFGSETPSGSGHALSIDADAIVDDGPDRGLRTETPPRPGSRRLLSAAAVVLIVVGVAGVWFTVGNREAGDPAPAQQPSSTTTESAPASQPPAPPVWYDTIRPLLPDGFDQIVLTTAQPEVVAFKAFRTGTRQLLDITITLQSGYDMKDTGEAATFSDQHGDYTESTSSVALTTPDQRQVIVRCGLSPVGGGVVESVSLADSARDYCGDGFDNLDLDPASRRALAATLADEFPTDAVTPAFGQPDTSAEQAAFTQIVDDFVGDTRPFGMEQADGVLRVTNLSPNVGEPSSTELTVIHGIWPPDGDGSAFDDTYANSPQGRFFQYGDIAVALVVVDGTGYHITTSDVSQDSLDRLGEFLQHLIATVSQPASPLPESTNAISGSTTTTNTTVVVPATNDLAGALRPDGTVLVVNATTTAGLAGSLSSALELSGYTVVSAETSANGTMLDKSIIYTDRDAPLSIMSIRDAIEAAVPIPIGEVLQGQPTPALTPEMIDSADVIVVLGDDLAGAPWQNAPTPLIGTSIGRLLIVDATSTDAGHARANARAQELRDAGVAVAGVVTATTPSEATVLMPIGTTTPWTFAIAELTGIDGFDTWSPDLIATSLPDGVTAALMIAED